MKNVTITSLNFIEPFPPPYYREVWYFKNAKTEFIEKET